MRIKMKRFLGILLSLALVLGLMPGMSLTVYAATTYSSGTSVTVAKVGETEYATLSDALTAWIDGSTLTLLADVETASTITVSATKILDLNGHNITMTGSGNIISVGSGAALTLKGKGSVGEIDNYGTLDFYDATASVIWTKGGTTNIYSGSVTATNPSWVAVNVSERATVNIFGGTIYASGWRCVHANNSTVNISGGIFQSSVAPLTVENGGKIILSGGYFQQNDVGNYTLKDGYAMIDSNDLEKGAKMVCAVIDGITLAPTTVTLTVGGTQKLTATVSPEIATFKTVTWTSSNEAVATVDENGVVTAVAAGTANITATATNGTGDTADDKTATCAVTVNKLGSAVKKAPEAKTLTYTGSAQELVTTGTAEGGTMQYARGKDATTAPTEGWGTSLPTATNAGTYYVWYKVVGDENHSDTTPACVIAKIDKGNPSANISEKETIKYSGEPQELVTPGTVENGIMMYALGSDDKTAPKKGEYSTSIPTGTAPGTYYVWYYAKGNAGYEDTTPVCVIVTIYELRADAEIDKSKLPDGKNTSVAGDIPIPEGLLSEAQKANNGNEKVELKLVVAPKGEEKAAESETLQKDAQMSNSVKSQYKDENSVSVEVLEIDIEKYINYAKADNVIETSKVLEIAIPYNFEGKYDPSVVRRHGDGVHVFTALSERPTGESKDGTFFADRDNHILYIYANLFSTYVVAYSTVEGNARGVSAGTSSSQVDYPKTIPVYRLYNKYKGAHLLTTNNEERDILLGEKATEGWIDEGIAFNVAVNSSAPVYRVFDLKNGIHFYTTDAATRDTYVANGCRDEGIAWYAALKPGRTVYKVSNPSNGRILYTISKPEADALTNSGYTCQEAEFVVY